MVMFTLPAEEVVVVQSDDSIVTSVAEFDEHGTGDVERTQVEPSSPV